MIEIGQIKNLAHDIFPEVRGFRRHLHKFPELSYQEFRTAEFIIQQLQRMGIEHEKGIGGNGISAWINRGHPGNVIALRADMDALPIQEMNEVEYCSTVPGVMHACGHDVHTTCLLGAAKILQTLKDEILHPVQLIFQPAEEVLPGGAKAMLDEGLFASRQPTKIIGQHVYPELPAGKVGFCEGAYMASTDEIYLRVIGKGGHGAKPQGNIDPVLISAHILTALQQVVSRSANPATPSVLSFGRVIAEGATNIIPTHVDMAGTFRTFDEQWRNEAHQLIERTCSGIAASLGGRIELEIRRGYPVLKNDIEVTRRSRKSAESFLGVDCVMSINPRMTAEDFAYYTHVVPGCFYRLGTSSPDGNGFNHGIHHPQFDIDESALITGMG
ncbi:MAG: M20 family metallopeptidase, partial [Flavobacteriales bacterium]